MTTHEPDPTTPAEMYEAYYGPAIFTPLAEILTSRVAPYPGERVLDLACGTGLVARAIAPMIGEKGRIVALDLNPAMIATGSSLPAPDGATIEWREGNAVELDFPDDTFDLACCQQGLQFFPDRAAALRHLHRVVVPGGRVVIALWRDVDHHPMFRAIGEAEEEHFSDLGMTMEDRIAPFSLGDRGEIEALIDGAGFSSIELAEHTIDARFPDPDNFIRKMEFAYSAVVPEFAADMAAFDAFVDTITLETRELVRSHTRGDHVIVPMHTWIAVARAG